MVRKFYFLGLIALAGIIIGFAWAEQITLTTYYPAPYGVYREFTTTSNTFLARDSGNVGIGTESLQAKLHIGGTAGTDGIRFPDGTTQTSAAGGFGAWTDRDSSGSTILGNLSNGSANQYQATGGGFVVVRCNGNFARVHVFVRFGGTGSFVDIYDAFANSGGGMESATIPLGKDDILYVNTNRGDNTFTIHWKPFGTAQLVKQ